MSFALVPALHVDGIFRIHMETQNEDRLRGGIKLCSFDIAIETLLRLAWAAGVPTLSQRYAHHRRGCGSDHKDDPHDLVNCLRGPAKAEHLFLGVVRAYGNKRRSFIPQFVGSESVSYIQSIFTYAILETQPFITDVEGLH